MFADSGAYFIGSRFGRHKLSPRLSPKKTWEGYFGGIVVGVTLTTLLAALLQSIAGVNISYHSSYRGTRGSGDGNCPNFG